MTGVRNRSEQMDVSDKISGGHGAASLGYLALFILTALPVSSPQAVQAANKHQRVNSFYGQPASAIFKRGNYAQAMRFANGELAKNPGNAAAQVLKVELLGYQQRTQHQALALARKYFKQSPGSLDLERSLAHLLFLNEDNEEARKHYRHIVKKVPDDVDSLAFLSSLEHRLHNDDQALILINRALKLEPKNSGNHYLKARIYMHQKKDNLALEALTQALKFQPGNIQALHKRAVLFTLKKDWTRALIDYNSLVKLNSSDYRTLEKRGFVLEKLGKNDLALKDYSLALSKAPNHRPVLVARARLYDKLGSPKLAKKDRIRLKKLDSDLVPFSFAPDWTK